MAKVDNPNKRILGSSNLIVTSNIEEPATYSFTLRCVEGLSNTNITEQSIYDITADPNKTNPIGILEDVSVPVEITVQVPIGHQLSISGLKSGDPISSGWGVSGPTLINCNCEEDTSYGYLPNEITVNIQDSPASMKFSWSYGR